MVVEEKKVEEEELKRVMEDEGVFIVCVVVRGV